MKNPIAVFITDTHLSEKTLEVNFHVWQQSFKLCNELGVKQLFHGGDVFTSRKGQPEIVLNAFKTILDMAVDVDIKIIAIAGNHDKHSYVAESSFLDAFNGQPNFKCISPLGSVKHKSGVIIHFLPYYDEQLMYFDYLKQLECPLNVKNILITHVAIEGVINNNESKVENEINQKLFDKFDLVLVGHYHNRQIIGDNIVYTGSAYQANHGENLFKGATVIYDDCSYEFVQFDFPQYNTIEIDVSELNRDLLKHAKEKDENVNVRFKINGTIEEKHKAIISELQQLPGVKAEVVKDDYKIIDITQIQNVQMTSNDIIATYDDWVKDRKIENAEFGKNLLNQVI